MLTVVVGVLLLLVAQRAFVLWREWSSARGLASAALAVAVVALGLTSYPEVEHQRVQARATALVVHVSRVPGSVARCERFTPDLFDLSAYSGFVSSDTTKVAQLRRTVCNDLADWLRSAKDDPTPDQIRAVHVVVHEAMHVRGEHDEATAECAAMQADTDAAVFLGASPSQARALTQAYYRDTYPHLADGYTTPACAADGALDRTPGDGRFP